MAKDMVGRWQIMGPADPIVMGKARKRFRAWECKCTCGTVRVVAEQALRSGKSQSCGCLAKERASAANSIHGATRGGGKRPEYSAWSNMIRRCHNPADKRFHQYGGRGITVCDAWRHDFAAFLDHVGPRPTPRHSLGRIDNDKPYEPGNVRWETGKQQMRNRTVTRYFEVDGQRVSLAELAERTGLPQNTLRFRLIKGWDQQRAFTTPVRPKAPNGSAKSS